MLIEDSEFELWIPSLELLFLQSFEKSPPRGLIEWRYLLGPVDRILFAFEMQNERLISSYSLSPQVMCDEGVQFETALSMTTMTHPDFQGRGLFPKLASELYASIEESFGFAYGFPNPKSRGIFSKKLGWESIYEVPTLVLREGKGVVSSRVKECTRIDRPIQEPTWLESFVHVCRDNNYVNWRFSTHPSNKYTMFTIEEQGNVVSYAVVKQFHESWDLVDFVPQDDSDAGEILSHIIESAMSSGTNQINTWHPIHSPFRILFEKTGFSNEGPVTYFGGRSLNKQVPRDWSRWYVQMADSDVY